MIRSSDLVDQIKEKCELVDYVSQVTALKKAGKSYTGLCPFHKEKTPSFHVYERPDRFYCFGCQVNGDIFTFIQQYYNIPFPEALKRLANDAGLQLPSRNQSHAQESLQQETLAALSQTAAHYRQALLDLPIDHPAKLMLSARAIRPEIAQLFQIGWAPYVDGSLLSLWPKQKQALTAAGLILEQHVGKTRDRFINRLMFPITDKSNKVVGFGGRIVIKSPEKNYPKYLNSPETELFKKNTLLYGLPLALQHHQFKSFLIVEGYFDVIQLFNHQLPCAIAPMGTALSELHIEQLIKYGRELIFCFDGDQAGQQAAFKALTLLLPYYNHKVTFSFVTLPEKEDPDSFLLKNGREKFIKLCQNRVKIGEWLFQKMEVLYPLDKIDNKIKFLAEAKKLIGLIQDPDARLTMLEVLRSLNVGARGFNKIPKKNVVMLPNAKPLDLLAAIMAKDPLLINGLDEKTKALLMQSDHVGLKSLLSSQIDSSHFKQHQQAILMKYGSLVDILPQEGLKTELEQQIKGLTGLLNDSSID